MAVLDFVGKSCQSDRMGFLSNLFRSSRNGQGQEAEGSEIRVAGLARKVSDLEERCARLEARDLDRSATLLNAADKLSRATERYRKLRARDGQRDDAEGDSGDDWLTAYNAYRGRGGGASRARDLELDLEDEEE